MAGVRTIAVMTVGGVRGAVTLAGVLSIPIALSDGVLRCRAATAIFVASAVILGSLVVVGGRPAAVAARRCSSRSPLGDEERAPRADRHRHCDPHERQHRPALLREAHESVPTHSCLRGARPC